MIPHILHRQSEIQHSSGTHTKPFIEQGPSEGVRPDLSDSKPSIFNQSTVLSVGKGMIWIFYKVIFFKAMSLLQTMKELINH